MTDINAKSTDTDSNTIKVGDTFTGPVIRVVKGAAIVRLPNGAEGYLHVSQLIGNTETARDERLGKFDDQSMVTVEVTKETKDGDKTQYRVSEFAVVRRERADAEKRLEAHLDATPVGQVIDGTVVRKNEDRKFLVVDIGEGANGVLHISRLKGFRPADRDAAFAEIEEGHTLSVFISETPVKDEKKRWQIKLSEAGGSTSQS